MMKLISFLATGNSLGHRYSQTCQKSVQQYTYGHRSDYVYVHVQQPAGFICHNIKIASFKQYSTRWWNFPSESKLLHSASRVKSGQPPPYHWSEMDEKLTFESITNIASAVCSLRASKINKVKLGTHVMMHI